MKKIDLLICGCVLASLLSSVASAATYTFSFTGSGGGPVGAGTLTTGNVVNAVGGFDILGVTGVFDGNVISGLIINPNQPMFTSPGGFTYDNVLFPTGPLVFSRYGIAFTAGSAINIFDSAADGGAPPAGSPYGLITPAAATFGSFSIAAVPEPATWFTMIAGFGLIGNTMRQRRIRTAKIFA